MMGAWWNKKWRIVNGFSCRKCAEFCPEEMRLYKREFQYQGCKLWSLLNLMGYQTINIHIYLYINIDFFKALCRISLFSNSLCITGREIKQKFEMWLMVVYESRFSIFSAPSGLQVTPLSPQAGKKQECLLSRLYSYILKFSVHHPYRNKTEIWNVIDGSCLKVDFLCLCCVLNADTDVWCVLFSSDDLKQDWWSPR